MTRPNRSVGQDAAFFLKLLCTNGACLWRPAVLSRANGKINRVLNGMPLLPVGTADRLQYQLWTCVQCTLKGCFQRYSISAGINVKVLGPTGWLVASEHRQSEKHGPPREQGMEWCFAAPKSWERPAVIISPIRERSPILGVDAGWHWPDAAHLNHPRVDVIFDVANRVRIGLMNFEAWPFATGKRRISIQVLTDLIFGGPIVRLPRYTANPARHLASALKLTIKVVVGEKQRRLTTGLSDPHRTYVRYRRPDIAQQSTLRQGARIQQSRKLSEAAPSLVNDCEFVQWRLLRQIRHLDAVLAQPPLMAVCINGSSGDSPACLTQSVEQQNWARRVVDCGGCREQVLCLLQGRAEDLTALAFVRAPRWALALSANELPEHISADRTDIAEGAANSVPRCARKSHRIGHAEMIARWTRSSERVSPCILRFERGACRATASRLPAKRISRVSPSCGES